MTEAPNRSIYITETDARGREIKHACLPDSGILEKLYFITLPNFKTPGFAATFEDNVSIGVGTSIGTNCHVKGGSVIGKNCHLSCNVTINRNVEIGDNAYVSSGSNIPTGTHVGPGAILGPATIEVIANLGTETERNYVRTAYRNSIGQVRITVGCRDLTLEEARHHWGAGYFGHRKIGDEYLALIDYVEKISGGNS